MASTFHNVGRGGAGNYISDQTTTEKDVEAQVPSTAVEVEPASRPAPQYAYSGRGGSGNIFSPQTLERSGTFSSPQASTPIALNEKLLSIGRGGAGNMQKNEVEQELENEKTMKQERRRDEDMVKDVEIGVMSPKKAHLSDEYSGDGTWVSTACDDLG